MSHTECTNENLKEYDTIAIFNVTVKLQLWYSVTILIGPQIGQKGVCFINSLVEQC